MRIVQTESGITVILGSIRELNRKDRLLTILGQSVEIIIQVILQAICQAIRSLTIRQKICQDRFSARIIATIQQDFCFQSFSGPYIRTTNLSLSLRQILDRCIDRGNNLIIDIHVVMYLRIVLRIILIYPRDIWTKYAHTLKISQSLQEFQLA